MDYCDDNSISLYFPRTNSTNNGLNEVIYLYKYLCPVILVGCLIGISLNVVLVVIGNFKCANKSPIFRLSLNLASTDALSSLLFSIGLFVNTYLPIVLEIKSSNECFLLILEIIRMSGLMSSSLHLLALAIVYYRGTSNPLHYRFSIFCSVHLTRSINCVSMMCWAMPMIAFTIYFISIPCQGFLSSNCDHHFLYSCRYRVTVTISFITPLIIMLVLYIKIFYIIKSRKKIKLNETTSARLKRDNKFDESSRRVASVELRESSRRVASVELRNSCDSTSDSQLRLSENNHKNHENQRAEKKKKNILISLSDISSTKLKLTVKCENQDQITSSSRNNSYTRQINKNRQSLRSNMTNSYPRKALITTLIILGTYLLCWMPGVIFLSLTCQDGCPFPLLSIPLKTRVIFGFVTNSLITMKAIVDPFIYLFRMKEINSVLNQYACLRKSFTNYGATSANASSKDASER